MTIPYTPTRQILTRLPFIIALPIYNFRSQTEGQTQTGAMAGPLGFEPRISGLEGRRAFWRMPYPSCATDPFQDLDITL